MLACVHACPLVCVRVFPLAGVCACPLVLACVRACLLVLACVRACLLVLACVPVSVCTRVPISVSVRTRVLASVRTHMPVCVHTCMYVSVSVHTRVPVSASKRAESLSQRPESRISSPLKHTPPPPSPPLSLRRRYALLSLRYEQFQCPSSLEKTSAPPPATHARTNAALSGEEEAARSRGSR